MKILKLAITGKMGTGKSSLTALLKEQENAYVTSYSSVIRGVILGLDLQPSRDLMQATGDFFRKYNQDVWTDCLLKEVSTISRTVIIEGIRYEFERDKLASKGFKIIKVLSRDDLRRKRIENREKIHLNDDVWVTWQNHPTEIYVDRIKADYEIENNDSLDSLRHSVSKMLVELKNTI